MGMLSGSVESTMDPNEYVFGHGNWNVCNMLVCDSTWLNSFSYK